MNTVEKKTDYLLFLSIYLAIVLNHQMVNGWMIKVEKKSISEPSMVVYFSKHSKLDFLIVSNEKVPTSHDHLSNRNCYDGIYCGNNYKRKIKPCYISGALSNNLENRPWNFPIKKKSQWWGLCHSNKILVNTVTIYLGEEWICSLNCYSLMEKESIQPRRKSLPHLRGLKTLSPWNISCQIHDGSFFDILISTN